MLGAAPGSGRRGGRRLPGLWMARSRGEGPPPASVRRAVPARTAGGGGLLRQQQPRTTAAASRMAAGKGTPPVPPEARRWVPPTGTTAEELEGQLDELGCPPDRPQAFAYVRDRTRGACGPYPELHPAAVLFLQLALWRRQLEGVEGKVAQRLNPAPARMNPPRLPGGLAEHLEQRLSERVLRGVDSASKWWKRGGRETTPQSRTLVVDAFLKQESQRMGRVMRTIVGPAPPRPSRKNVKRKRGAAEAPPVAPRPTRKEGEKAKAAISSLAATEAKETAEEMVRTALEIGGILAGSPGPTSHLPSPILVPAPMERYKNRLVETLATGCFGIDLMVAEEGLPLGGSCDPARVSLANRAAMRFPTPAYREGGPRHTLDLMAPDLLLDPATWMVVFSCPCTTVSSLASSNLGFKSQARHFAKHGSGMVHHFFELLQRSFWKHRCRPKVVVMEQVAGILDLDGQTGRPFLLLYVERLHEMGYNVAVS